MVSTSNIIATTPFYLVFVITLILLCFLLYRYIVETFSEGKYPIRVVFGPHIASDVNSQSHDDNTLVTKFCKLIRARNLSSGPSPSEFSNFFFFICWAPLKIVLRTGPGQMTRENGPSTLLSKPRSLCVRLSFALRILLTVSVTTRNAKGNSWK